MTKTECSNCRGTGTRRDATLADKICASGNTVAQCSTCRGAGYTETLSMAEMIAEAEAFMARKS